MDISYHKSEYSYKCIDILTHRLNLVKSFCFLPLVRTVFTQGQLCLLRINLKYPNFENGLIHLFFFFLPPFQKANAINKLILCNFIPPVELKSLHFFETNRIILLLDNCNSSPETLLNLLIYKLIYGCCVCRKTPRFQGNAVLQKIYMSKKHIYSNKYIKICFPMFAK